MGTGLFDYIAQACQSLASTAAPSITAMGTHIVLALATQSSATVTVIATAMASAGLMTLEGQ